MNKMQYITIIFILLTSFGCHNMRKHEQNDELQTVSSQDLSMKFIIDKTNNQIDVAIYNVSNEKLFIELSKPGLGFDLEYLTTNNTVVYLKGISYGTLVFPLIAYYTLEPAPNYVLNTDSFIVSPYHTLSLAIPFVPDDLQKVRRIECLVRYIKMSDFQKIKNEEDLYSVMSQNRLKLRCITQEYFPNTVNPIPTPTLRGYLR